MPREDIFAAVTYQKLRYAFTSMYFDIDSCIIASDRSECFWFIFWT
jgi:hypothetical protein